MTRVPRKRWLPATKSSSRRIVDKPTVNVSGPSKGWIFRCRLEVRIGSVSRGYFSSRKLRSRVWQADDGFLQGRRFGDTGSSVLIVVLLYQHNLNVVSG